jgi:hypothetical protein
MFNIVGCRVDIPSIVAVNTHICSSESYPSNARTLTWVHDLAPFFFHYALGLSSTKRRSLPRIQLTWLYHHHGRLWTFTSLSIWLLQVVSAIVSPFKRGFLFVSPGITVPYILELESGRNFSLQAAAYRTSTYALYKSRGTTMV